MLLVAIRCGVSDGAAGLEMLKTAVPRIELPLIEVARCPTMSRVPSGLTNAETTRRARVPPHVNENAGLTVLVDILSSAR